MTAQCGGGTSSVKPGAAAIVTYSAGLIADLLVLIESPWLIPVIPLLGLAPLTTASFCASDPPAMPTFTPAEANALLNLEIGTSDWNSGVTKVSNALQNAVWNQFCKCDNGTAIPTPTGPPPPTGTPVIQLPGSPGSSPCQQFFYATQSPDGPGSTSENRGGPGLTIGASPTSFTFISKNTIDVAPGASIGFTWQQANTAGTTLASVTRTPAIGATDSVTVPAVAGVTNIRLQTATSGATGSSFITNSEVDVFCSGAGFPPGTTNCPPDPATQALLEAILKMVTLIQRQHVPFAYIKGSAHGPLNGSGQFNLDDVIIGLEVDVSGIDSTVG